MAVPTTSEGVPVATAAPQNPIKGPEQAKVGELALYFRFWKFGLSVAVIMVILALVGVGLSTADAPKARTFWFCLVPAYGLLCIATAWYRARLLHQTDHSAMIRQLFHWLGVGLALGVDFFLHSSGEETGVAAGETTLLLLALGCFLAGIHFERTFILVGILLTVILFFITKLDQYLWLIFVAAGLILAVLMGFWWYFHNRGRKQALGHPSAAS